MSIADILDRVVATEGGYTNNADDLGGPTIWGITERVARKHGYSGPMQAMTRNIAKGIYLLAYVEAPGFDKVYAISPRVAEELIDTGVNMGTAIAATMLQRCLNALNNKGTLYGDIRVDGDCGPATIGALTSYMKLRGPHAESVLLRALNGLQLERYVAISESRQANETFTFGWILNRVAV
jgi:lysozyme family protein